jgi:hypothetical protein
MFYLVCCFNLYSAEEGFEIVENSSSRLQEPGTLTNQPEGQKKNSFDNFISPRLRNGDSSFLNKSVGILGARWDNSAHVVLYLVLEI